jgi:hypothetical protein
MRFLALAREAGNFLERSECRYRLNGLPAYTVRD